ncbi:MAG: DMT family transporter [Gemmatimonadales bacterium]
MTPRQAVVWLVLVSLVWGISFTIIKEILGFVSPLLLMGIRFGLASLVLIGSFRGISRYELSGGLVLGVLFWGGFAFQTFGLEETTPSRSAFITSLSAPLVPVVAFMVYRALPRAHTIAAVLLAGVGMYFLTLPDSAAQGPNRGDLLTLGCAVLFAGQIVAAGHFSRRAPPIRLLAVEMATTAGLSLLLVPLLETPRLTLDAWVGLALLFLALSGVWSFYLQLRAQQVLSPTHTALLFMLEPVFAAWTSFLVLGERLSPVQWAGAALILAAMALPGLRPLRPLRPL